MGLCVATHAYHGFFDTIMLDQAGLVHVLNQFGVSGSGAIPRHGEGPCRVPADSLMDSLKSVEHVGVREPIKVGLKAVLEAFGDDLVKSREATGLVTPCSPHPPRDGFSMNCLASQHRRDTILATFMYKVCLMLFCSIVPGYCKFVFKDMSCRERGTW